jgi:hypothetical protein
LSKHKEIPRMDAMDDGSDRIVARFAQFVKQVRSEFASLESPDLARAMEERVRDGGREVLLLLLQDCLQAGIDHSQEKLRQCSCGKKRKHCGVRPRWLVSSLGAIRLWGIYWQCEYCGESAHGVDLASEQRLSEVLKELVLLVGVSTGSFDKAELLAEKMLGMRVDDDAIRCFCEAEGQKALGRPPRLVAAEPGQPIWGSCDGTMVNTREEGWKEVRAARFTHAGGEFATAAWETSEKFVPRMVQMARMLTPVNPGRLMFASDLAEWITRGVGQHLPGWMHMADRWHVRQHITPVAEELYGKGDKDAEDFREYFGAELMCVGGAALADELRGTAMSYPDLRHQRAVLDLARFFGKHAERMDYPRYIREGLAMDSGPMESLCKQMGQRLKGPGMRWSLKNISGMAYVVARWAVDPRRAVREGLAAAA